MKTKYKSVSKTIKRWYWELKIYRIIYGIKVKIHKWSIKKFPFCHGAEGPCFHKGKKRRQNTAYVDDKMNWIFLCNECAEINDEQWQERWDEYYAGCM